MDLISPGLGLIVWTSLAFLVVLFFLKKYAWKPILSGISEREKKIEDALKSAEIAEKKILEINAKNENLLVEAVKDREAIMKAARIASDKMIAEAKERAQEEASKIVAQARETIHNEKMRVMTDLKNEVGKLSVDIAEKIMRDRLSDEEKQKDSFKKLLNEVNFN